MCDARCSRRERGVLSRAASKRSSEIWPAVLHRHCSTENRVTPLTQSRESRSESSVSASPKPSGLTTPAATTATRVVPFLPFALSDLAIVQRLNCSTNFYCFRIRTNLQVTPKGETEARKLVDCQLSLFSDDLKSDKREQLPGCVFQNKLNGN